MSEQKTKYERICSYLLNQGYSTDGQETTEQDFDENYMNAANLMIEEIAKLREEIKDKQCLITDLNNLLDKRESTIDELERGINER